METLRHMSTFSLHVDSWLVDMGYDDYLSKVSWLMCVFPHGFLREYCCINWLQEQHKPLRYHLFDCFRMYFSVV